MKRVIITGATGMIGSHLTENLLEKGIDVTAIVRENSQKLCNIASYKVEVIECDNDDILSLPKLVQGKFDTFYHFGWEGVFGNSRNDACLQEKNIKNTLNAIQVAKTLGCDKFVIAGSQAEYGLCDKKLTCNTCANPITAYGIAKNAAFNLGKVLGKQINIEINNGRILSAYGTMDNGYTMIMSTLTNILNGKECNLTDCQQVWDFINAEDVAEAFYCIGEHGVDGKAYPIGSGQPRRLKEYVAEMYLLANNPKAKLNFGAVQLAENAVKHLAADIEELTADTGFLPQVSFKEGILKLIEFLNSSIINV